MFILYKKEEKKNNKKKKVSIKELLIKINIFFFINHSKDEFSNIRNSEKKKKNLKEKYLKKKKIY